MLGGLKDKAPEEQDAEDYQDGNNDDLNETHCHFLTADKPGGLNRNSSRVGGACQYALAGRNACRAGIAKPQKLHCL